MLKIGIDVGSTTAKMVVTDEDGRIVHSIYERHGARIREVLADFFDGLQRKVGDEDVTVCITGSIGMGVAEKTGLPVKGFCSGPLGGDQQIGAKIVEGQIDFMIFLWDPLEAQPHDPDVKALLRIAVVYDIPIANNLATADFMLNSRYMSEPYARKIENFNRTIQQRVERMK